MRTSSTSTMRRAPGGSSSNLATVVQSDIATSRPRLKQAGLQARRLGHAALIPLRLEHELDVHIGDVGRAAHLALHVLLQDRAHAAARRGERHLDVAAVAALGQRHDVAFIDEPELDDVDRDFGIVAGRELLPHELFVDGAVAGERLVVARVMLREFAERIGILAGDTHETAFDITRVAAAERLRDGDLLARGQGHLRPGGDQHGIAVAAQGHYFVAAHGFSVVTGCSWCASVACSVCQASVAHLTRAGYSRTPSSTVSLPRAAVSASPGWAWVSWSCLRPFFASASSTFMPCKRSVMSEAEAVEIAQPMPSKRTSAMTSFSTLR